MKYFLIILTIVLIVLSLFFIVSKNENPTLSPQKTSTPKAKPIEVDYSASFEIYTLGTKRIFADPKYHNLSKEVYISNPDPSVVKIKKEGVTWSQFFETLPMKLTKECLTTGTGQVFCTNETRSLKFFINEIENKNSLNEQIKPNDKLRVVFE